MKLLAPAPLFTAKDLVGPLAYLKGNSLASLFHLSMKRLMLLCISKKMTMDMPCFFVYSLVKEGRT